MSLFNDEAAKRPSVYEVFATFLSLGLTSFGGPIAHLGFFRETFVQRKRWLSDERYADLVALCQFLPGPASSQVGMAIGYQAAGLAGAGAAFVAFTAPSAVIMLLAGLGVSYFHGPVACGIVHGLKVAAVAIVAQAVWSMGKGLCPDRARQGFAVVAAILMLLVPTTLAQIFVIICGGIAGSLLLASEGEGPQQRVALSASARRQATLGLGSYAVLLVLLPILALATTSLAVQLFDAYYRTGALVFGGGHVVLPLLEREVVESGWVTADAFLAGYGIAQAVPGPLFTFATFLGAVNVDSPNGIVGALLTTLAIFLPSFLLVYGGLPLWEWLRTEPRLRRALMGTNAAVVGLLVAALYDPVFVSAIQSRTDFALALFAFGLLAIWKLPPFQVVVLTAAGGLVLSIGTSC